MTEILLGLISAGVGVVLFVAGFFFGRHSVPRGGPPALLSTDCEPPELPEAQRRKIEADQKAFESLMGYSADVAYGVTAMPEIT